MKGSREKSTLKKVDFRAQLFSPDTVLPGARDALTNYADIAVHGSVENVQQLVQTAFATNQFKVNWASAVKGKAEKGSKGMNLALGALAQYYAVDFEIYPGSGNATLRLYQANSGWVGGAIGAHRVKKQFDELYRLMTTWFQQQGVLLGAAQGKA